MNVEKTDHNAPPLPLPEYLAMVLLIDDQPIVGQAVRNLLADERDIDFHFCSDPSQALALAGELRPTVILQDLVMPDVDGLQLVRMMRRNPATADTPIIVLSGKEDPISKRDAFAAGANDYLVKLPDKMELVARTRYHSRGHLNRIQRDEAYRALRESQQKLLESNSRLQATNRELESATRVKSEFLANMSHEIRTPLSGVIGMTTLLSDTALTKEQESFVETIRNCASSLLELINDILDFSKIEAGKLDFENQPFDMIACVEETLELLATKAGEKNLSLGYSLDPSIPKTLFGDVGRIRQILMNLVGNAIKFTLQGEVSLNIFRRANRHGAIEFSVRDTGIGIPQDKHDRLFKSFSQVDRATMTRFGGTGLGLAISKTLCEEMGGEIWVESEAERGSTFHFTLPLAPPGGAVATGKNLPEEFSGKHVVVIEDKPLHLQILKSRLEGLGMFPATAISTDEAFQRIRSGDRLDAVVLSSRFSGLDPNGILDLVKQIRKEASAKEIPLILTVPPHAKRLLIQAGLSEVSLLLHEPIRESQLHDAFLSAFRPNARSFDAASKISETSDNIALRFPLRILVAEDNGVNRRIALGFLNKFGYRADTAANGLEAIASLERQSYDLILMDVQMPDMDGLEASRKIRSRWSGPSAPKIIAMTANAMEGDREKCLQSGMDDYISKPISLQSVKAALERWGDKILKERFTATGRS